MVRRDSFSYTRHSWTRVTHGPRSGSESFPHLGFELVPEVFRDALFHAADQDGGPLGDLDVDGLVGGEYHHVACPWFFPSFSASVAGSHQFAAGSGDLYVKHLPGQDSQKPARSPESVRAIAPVKSAALFYQKLTAIVRTCWHLCKRPTSQRACSVPAP
jgi:hypothetical protein